MSSTFMSVLIHGTHVPEDPWSMPESDFWTFVSDEVFVSTKQATELIDRVQWNAGWGNNARRIGVNEALDQLLRLKSAYGVDEFRLIGHSHGGTIANAVTGRLAEHKIPVRTLINLSTPVRYASSRPRPNPAAGPLYPDEHLPLLTNVRWNRFFHFHADKDPVVVNCPVTPMSACANQSFSGTPAAANEANEFKPGSRGHWLATDPQDWRDNGWIAMVQDL